MGWIWGCRYSRGWGYFDPDCERCEAGSRKKVATREAAERLADAHEARAGAGHSTWVRNIGNRKLR